MININVMLPASSRLFKPVRIYGAGPSNEPAYWGRYLGRVNVNQRCDALFGPVFEQYDLVCLVRADGSEHPLARDASLLSAVRDANLLGGDVKVYARNSTGGVV